MLETILIFLQINSANGCNFQTVLHKANSEQAQAQNARVEFKILDGVYVNLQNL